GRDSAPARGACRDAERPSLRSHAERGNERELPEHKKKERKMGTKLGKNEFPTSHGADDFKCFGPPALKDGEFENCKIADLGCFTQDGKDSNKRYHGAVVQSKKT